jgi:hypothetical protein
MGIEDKRILKNDVLPSINEFSYELEIPRDTERSLPPFKLWGSFTPFLKGIFHRK